MTQVAGVRAVLALCVLAGHAAAQPAPEAASPPDVDLGALGLDPGGASYDDHLNVYGFADVSWLAEHWNRDPVLAARDSKSFSVGNLNIYLAKNLSEKARALAEIRFTYLPNGTRNADGSITDTNTQDISMFLTPTQWGGIVIERAYVEYDLTDHITVRGGHWLTPYGIWNIDHGSPVIIGSMRPYIITVQMFPEHQTGLDVLGNYTLGDYKLLAHLTASNGRGATEAQIDQDDHMGLGGSLELEAAWGGKLGGSYYRGRYTGLTAVPGTAPETYLEAAYGGHASYDHGALHVQAELIVRDRHYPSAEVVPLVLDAPSPDARDWGWYALAGYRTSQLWNVMPFAAYEAYKPADHALYSKVYGGTVGLNFRPSPNLVFKVSGLRADFDGTGPFGGLHTYALSTQASWVF